MFTAASHAAPRGRAPFVHAFAHAGRWLAYDVNTNALLEVDAALGRTLAVLAAGAATTDLARLSAEIGREALGTVLAEIEQAQRDEGLFLPHRPRIVPRSLSDADRAACESRLSHLILSVTDDCNLACRYCPQAAARGRTAPGPAMTPDIARRALSHFAARCAGVEVPAVSFYGGEPLLRPAFLRDLVGFARSFPAGPRLRLVVDTNGTLLDDDAIDFLVRERIHLQVSVDGPPAAHDRWRVFPDGRPSHALVMQGLERLLRRDPSAAERLSFQVTAAPPVDIDALSAWFAAPPVFRDLGIRQRVNIGLGFARPAGAAAQAARAPDLGGARARWLAACAADGRAGLDPVSRVLFDSEVIRFHHRSRVRLPAEITAGGCCLPGARRLFVTTAGSYWPCERMSMPLVIGDVDHGIVPAAVNRVYARFDAAVAGRCRDCWALRLCDLCFAALDRQDDNPDGLLREEWCAHMRIRARDMLATHADLVARGADAARFLVHSSLR